MSWRATAYVKTLTTMPATGAKLRPSQKLLLMVLSDYYNDEQEAAWPSLKRLAEESLVSKRSAITIIQECVAGGILTTETRRDSRGGHTSNYYRFVALAPSEAVSPPSEGGSSGGNAMTSPASENPAPPSEAMASPKRILNHRNELLEKESPATPEVAPLTTHVNDPRERSTEPSESISRAMPPEPYHVSVKYKGDPTILRFWRAMLDDSDLAGKLPKEIDRLRPRTWTDGVLTLHAPAYLARRHRLADDLLRLLAPVAPVELREVRLVNGS